MVPRCADYSMNPHSDIQGVVSVQLVLFEKNAQSMVAVTSPGPGSESVRVVLSTRVSLNVSTCYM